MSRIEWNGTAAGRGITPRPAAVVPVVFYISSQAVELRWWNFLT